jgi:hypothetical protein
LLKLGKKDVDARDKRRHDGGEVVRSHRNVLYVWVRPAPGQDPKADRFTPLILG